MDLEFTLVYEREDDWWLARIAEIPGAHSQGRTREEAREMALDAARELGLARREDALREATDAEALRVFVSVPSAA